MSRVLRVDVTRGDKVVDVSKQDAEAQAWFQVGFRVPDWARAPGCVMSAAARG